MENEEYIEPVPEIKDILEMIRRYNASNPQSIFVYGFWGFEKDPDHTCCECGEDCEQISERKSSMGALGNIYDLRDLLNNLRDMVEEEKDEEGMVNI